MNKIIISLWTALLVVGFSPRVGAVVPDLIPIQGVLTDDLGQPIDGPATLEITLWDAAEDGTELWSETYSEQDQVDVDEGFFTVYLGSLAPLSFASLLVHDELWLGMRVNGDAEMSRARFAAVPFAQEAQVCQRVGSLSADDINAGFSPLDHDHDDSYYTKTETDARLSGKADALHGHDNLYYTEAEIETLLGAKSDTGHLHEDEYVNATGDTMTGELLLTAGLSCTNCIDEGDVADGALSEAKLGFDPATQAELEEWRLDETTNGLISNEVDIIRTDASLTAIPDDGSVSTTIAVADTGTMLSAGVAVTLRHAWPDTVDISLTFTPADAAVSPIAIPLAEADPAAGCTGYCEVPADCDTPADPCVDQAYDWPTSDAVVSGSLDDFVGLNPSGNWELTVTDTCLSWPGACTDGTQYIIEFGINYRLLSNTMATVDGSLTIHEDLSVSGSVSTGTLDVSGGIAAGGDLSAANGSFGGDISATNGSLSGVLTVGGVSYAHVPQGMISMFAGPCPTGWSEFEALRGRFPRGEPTGNEDSLDEGGSDDAVVVTHGHTTTIGNSASGVSVNNDTHNHGTSDPGHWHSLWSRNDDFNCSGDNGGSYGIRSCADNGSHTWATTRAYAMSKTTGISVNNDTHNHGVTDPQHNHTATTANSGASGANANLPSYTEVIFCVKD